MNIRSPSYMKEAREIAEFYKTHTLSQTAKKFRPCEEIARRMIREAGGTIHSIRGRKPRDPSGPIDVIELPKERISLPQVAKSFDVGYDAVLRWIKGGGLPARFIEGQWVVYEDEINLTIDEIEANIVQDDRPKCDCCEIVLEEAGDSPSLVVCSDCRTRYQRSRDKSTWVPR